LSWHRDDIKPTVSPSEESEALGIKHHGIQWNAALYDDACLSAVPGSHRRVRTPAEREAHLSGGVMPGGKALELKKGETVFYNNNICEWPGMAWTGLEWCRVVQSGSE
jgi:ectoine hydroxylase-related dioxygenase (phytanoyl-CoA dioxygenase family)